MRLIFSLVCKFFMQCCNINKPLFVIVANIYSHSVLCLFAVVVFTSLSKLVATLFKIKKQNRKTNEWAQFAADRDGPFIHTFVNSSNKYPKHQLAQHSQFQCLSYPLIIHLASRDIQIHSSWTWSSLQFQMFLIFNIPAPSIISYLIFYGAIFF